VNKVALSVKSFHVSFKAEALLNVRENKKEVGFNLLHVLAFSLTAETFESHFQSLISYVDFKKKALCSIIAMCVKAE
jgi:hypothetical protein